MNKLVYAYAVSALLYVSCDAMENNPPKRLRVASEPAQVAAASADVHNNDDHVQAAAVLALKKYLLELILYRNQAAVQLYSEVYPQVYNAESYRAILLERRRTLQDPACEWGLFPHLARRQRILLQRIEFNLRMVNTDNETPASN